MSKLLDAMQLNSIGQQIQQIAFEMLEEVYEESTKQVKKVKP